MSKTKDKPVEPALTAAALSKVLAEQAKADRIEARNAEREAALEAKLAAQYAAEDAELEAEEQREAAAKAELERRAVDEKPGSLRHAARLAAAAGRDYLSSDELNGLSKDAYRELQDSLGPHRELYERSLVEFGNADAKARYQR